MLYYALLVQPVKYLTLLVIVSIRVRLLTVAVTQIKLARLFQYSV